MILIDLTHIIDLDDPSISSKSSSSLDVSLLWYPPLRAEFFIKAYGQLSWSRRARGPCQSSAWDVGDTTNCIQLLPLVGFNGWIPKPHIEYDVDLVIIYGHQGWWDMCGIFIDGIDENYWMNLIMTARPHSNDGDRLYNHPQMAASLRKNQASEWIITTQPDKLKHPNTNNYLYAKMLHVRRFEHVWNCHGKAQLKALSL